MRKTVIEVPLILIAILSLTATLPTYTQPLPATPKVNWVTSINPSSSVDDVHSVCASDNHIFVVGSYTVSPGDTGFRIEKRSRYSGEVLVTWSHNPSPWRDYLVDCVVVNNTLYAVGTYTTPDRDKAIAIAVLSQGLNLVSYITSNPTMYDDEALAVATDGYSIYIGGVTGYTSLTEVGRWYIEVRRASDLTFIGSYVGPMPSIETDIVFGININPATGYIWSVGSARFKILRDYVGEGLIRILDKNMNLLREARISEEMMFYDVAFDEDGYSYAVGLNYIVKLDRYGNVVEKSGCRNCFGIVLVHDYVYVVGIDRDGTTPRLILRVFNKQLHPLASLELIKSEDLYLSLGKIAFDGRYLYIAVSRKVSENDTEWVVVSVDTGLIIRYATVTVTTTRTISYPITEIATIRVTSTVTSTMAIIFTVIRVETKTEIKTATETVTKPYTETETLTVTKTMTSTATYTKPETITKPYTETKIETVTKPYTETLMLIATETRTVTEKDWLAIGLTAIIAVPLFLLGYMLGKKAKSKT